MAEFRPRSFQILPPVIKNLIIINVLVFLAQETFGKQIEFQIESYFALHDLHSALFRIWQPITYMFLHAGWDHILFNMFALWMFGAALENYWGPKRFLTFYMICGIGAALCDMAVMYVHFAPIMDQFNLLPPEQQEQYIYNPQFVVNGATLGASGAIFGCLAAFGYLFPNSEIYMYFLFPIKAKWFVLGYAGLELFLGFRNSSSDTVAHWAHLGGALFGILLVMYWNRSNRRDFY